MESVQDDYDPNTTHSVDQDALLGFLDRQFQYAVALPLAARTRALVVLSDSAVADALGYDPAEVATVRQQLRECGALVNATVQTPTGPLTMERQAIADPVNRSALPQPSRWDSAARLRADRQMTAIAKLPAMERRAHETVEQVFATMPDHWVSDPR